MITGVGIKLVTGELFCLPKPARHDDVHKLIMAAGFVRSIGDIEGFTSESIWIDWAEDYDEPVHFDQVESIFLNRTRALRIAKYNRQLLPGHDDRYTELFSEDLW